MKYRKLGDTDIEVSAICLGTMTWGEQNTEKDAHNQLDYALDHKINFIDTAEMYAVPARKETQGLTEKYIGTWLKNRKDRDKIILASKIAGPGSGTSYIRGGSKFTYNHIQKAVDDSLNRLQTDYIDLYQLHWPERKTNYFGKLGYKHKSDETGTPFNEVLESLRKIIETGKIRYIGISNETPWGAMRFLMAAEKYNLPKIVSIQNPYNLLNRTFEVGLAEIAMREKVGLLAYSPMAFGLLSGKYFENQYATGRIAMYEKMSRYNGETTRTAAKEYVHIAREAGLSPAQMALAFVTSREFVTSNIIGATSMDQLKENIDSFKVNLNEEVLEAIEAVHQKYPNPAP